MLPLAYAAKMRQRFHEPDGAAAADAQITNVC
jgi:hypothetical protein